MWVSRFPNVAGGFVASEVVQRHAIVGDLDSAIVTSEWAPFAHDAGFCKQTVTFVEGEGRPVFKAGFGTVADTHLVVGEHVERHAVGIDQEAAEFIGAADECNFG